MLAADLESFGAPETHPPGDPVVEPGDVVVVDVRFALPERRKPSEVNLSGLNLRVTVAFGEVEVTTGFLPLIYDGLLPPLESGQVIRVEVPRFALISYGLPLNAERADEPIKADVLLGQDGLARAIRLVH